jgi:hypothetical protein
MMARVRFFDSGYAFREWIWKVLNPENPSQCRE